MRYKPKHIEEIDAVKFNGENRQEVVALYVVHGVSHEKIMSFVQPLFEFFNDGYFVYSVKYKQMYYHYTETFNKLWEPELSSMFHINKQDIRFSIPNDDHADTKRIKKIAARAARANTVEKENKALDELVDIMRELDFENLNTWAIIMMIDHRWSGATGQGGYWAKASDFCNRAALQILRERSMFEVINDE